MARAAIVLQARMGSSRLPGKSLARIGDRSLLAHCVERLRLATRLPVIVATTTLAEDDAVEAEAARLLAPVVRGSATDVLSRYLLAADAFGLSHLVRATADNPAVDWEGADRAFQALVETAADHVVEGGLPIGAGVEAMTVWALRRSARLTQAPYDREHVTPHLRRTPGFRALITPAPRTLQRPHLRLTVDTEADLLFMRQLHGALGEPAASAPAPLGAIIAMARRLTTGRAMAGALR